MSEIREVNFTASQKMALGVWKEKLQMAEQMRSTVIQAFDAYMKALLAEIGVDPDAGWKFNTNWDGMVREGEDAATPPVKVKEFPKKN